MKVHGVGTYLSLKASERTYTAQSNALTAIARTKPTTTASLMSIASTERVCAVPLLMVVSIRSESQSL